MRKNFTYKNENCWSDFTDNVNQWVMHSYNWRIGEDGKPLFFDAFGEKDSSLRNHLYSKWKGYYNSEGSGGVMNRFWSELSGNNQEKLADWIKAYYTSYAKGGEVNPYFVRKSFYSEITDDGKEEGEEYGSWTQGANEKTGTGEDMRVVYFMGDSNHLLKEEPELEEDKIFKVHEEIYIDYTDKNGKKQIAYMLANSPDEVVRALKEEGAKSIERMRPEWEMHGTAYWEAYEENTLEASKIKPVTKVSKKVSKKAKKTKKVNVDLGPDVDEAVWGMDKWLPDDQEAIEEFQDIEDNGTEEQMIDYLNNWGDEEILYERYGLNSDAFPAMAKKIMHKSHAKGGEIKPRLKKGDIVEISANKWRDVNGNTYHNVQVYVNDNYIGESGMTYGYGNHYEQTAREMIFDKYKAPYSYNASNPIYMLKNKGVKVVSNSYQVNRKRDMLSFAKGGRILVGRFDEKQLKNKEDKKAIDKSQKESGLTYIDSKIIKKGGKMFMEVYLIPNDEYYKSSKFAKGGKTKKKLKVGDIEIDDKGRRMKVWYVDRDGFAWSEPIEENEVPAEEDSAAVSKNNDTSSVIGGKEDRWDELHDLIWTGAKCDEEECTVLVPQKYTLEEVEEQLERFNDNNNEWWIADEIEESDDGKHWVLESFNDEFAKGGEVKKKGTEMIMGGLAGILLGVFLNK